MDKNLVKSKEEIQGFSPYLKDMLCDTYDYIIKHLGTPITKENVSIANGAISIAGRPSEKFCDIYMANLDAIKKLSEERPTYLIDYLLVVPQHDSRYDTHGCELIDEHYRIDETTMVKCYNPDKIRNIIKYIQGKRYYHSHEISENQFGL